MQVKRILLVEDDERISDLLQEMLALLGHTAAVAHSAEQALGYLANEEFSVLLADVNLPGMSGIQLAERVYATCPSTKIVFTTGDGYLLTRPLPFDFTLVAKPFNFQSVRDAFKDIACTISVVPERRVERRMMSRYTQPDRRG